MKYIGNIIIIILILSLLTLVGVAVFATPSYKSPMVSDFELDIIDYKYLNDSNILYVHGTVKNNGTVASSPKIGCVGLIDKEIIEVTYFYINPGINIDPGEEVEVLHIITDNPDIKTCKCKVVDITIWNEDLKFNWSIEKV